MPVANVSDEFIAMMEIVQELSENQHGTQYINEETEYDGDELEKQNEFLSESITVFENVLSELNEKHKNAKKTISKLKEKIEKVKETVETEKAISNFEKTMKLTILQKDIQKIQREAATLQEDINTDPNGCDNSFDSGSNFFALLCEQLVNGAPIVLLRSL